MQKYEITGVDIRTGADRVLHVEASSVSKALAEAKALRVIIGSINGVDIDGLARGGRGGDGAVGLGKNRQVKVESQRRGGSHYARAFGKWVGCLLVFLKIRGHGAIDHGGVVVSGAEDGFALKTCDRCKSQVSSLTTTGDGLHICSVCYVGGHPVSLWRRWVVRGILAVGVGVVVAWGLVSWLGDDRGAVPASVPVVANNSASAIVSTPDPIRGLGWSVKEVRGLWGRDKGWEWANVDGVRMAKSQRISGVYYQVLGGNENIRGFNVYLELGEFEKPDSVAVKLFTAGKMCSRVAGSNTREAVDWIKNSYVTSLKSRLRKSSFSTRINRKADLSFLITPADNGLLVVVGVERI